MQFCVFINDARDRCPVWKTAIVFITLRAKLSGAVYCRRSCLWACLQRAGGRCPNLTTASARAQCLRLSERFFHWNVRVSVTYLTNRYLSLVLCSILLCCAFVCICCEYSVHSYYYNGWPAFLVAYRICTYIYKCTKFLIRQIKYDWWLIGCRSPALSLSLLRGRTST